MARRWDAAVSSWYRANSTVNAEACHISWPQSLEFIKATTRY